VSSCRLAIRIAKNRTRLLWLLIGVSYVALVLVLTWPAVRTLGGRLIGNNVDNWIFYWDDWWLGQAIAEGHNIFQTPYMFFPEGVSLVAHSNAWLNSFLAQPLTWIAGPVAAYNLVLLLSLWLSAMGMYWLALELTGMRGPSFVAGLVYAFAPYHLTQILSHGHLGAIQWWPFYALFLRRMLLRGQRRDAILAGVFAALSLWSGLQLALLLAMWTLLYLTWFLWRHRADLSTYRPIWSRLVGRLGLSGLVVLLLGLPLLLALLTNWQLLTAAAGRFNESLTRQTDLLAYLLPPTYQPLWGARFIPLYELFVANRALMPYLGLTTLVLVIYAAVVWFKRREGEVGFWLASGLVWFVLAAGPAPRIAGRVYQDLPLPYQWLAGTFPFSTLRAPDRFNLLLTFSLAVLVGAGLAAASKRHRLLVWLAGLLLAVEYLAVPLPSWDLPQVSPFLKELAAEPEAGAIVDYPMGYTYAKLWLYYQTIHGKPTVDGHVSRYTIETYRFIQEQPLLRSLYQESERPPYLPVDYFSSTDQDPPPLGPALRSLQEAGVRYVLVHREYADPGQLSMLAAKLPLAPIYEDDTLTAYDLTAPLPAAIDSLPAPLTETIQLHQLTSSLEGEDSDQTILKVRLLAQLIGAPPTNLRCHLSVPQLNLTQSFRLLEPADWRSGDLIDQDVSLTLPREVANGTYDWQISCPGGKPWWSPDQLKVADSSSLLQRQPVHVRFGSSIELEGYRWQRRGGELLVDLNWLARETPSSDYKYFVHLLNANNVIVRQYDAQPCNWACPTGGWRAGERVLDQIPLALTGLNPGSYRLAVGLYDPTTGERLSATIDGRPLAENYPILEEPIVLGSRT
jgi:hypothetical protein